MVPSRLLHLVAIANKADASILNYSFDFGYNAQNYCFSSTYSIINAQKNDIKSNSVRNTYTICPNTRINVGLVILQVGPSYVPTK